MHKNLFCGSYIIIYWSVRALGYFRDSSFGHFRDFLGVKTENRAFVLKNRVLFLKTVIFTDFSV